MVEAVLFDLDGTLADTAPDLGYALNLLLQKHGKREIPLALSRPMVSQGSRGMLEVGFAIKPGDVDYEMLKNDYLALYEANLNHHTRLFPGMDKVLNHLDQRGLPWGIVTNKHSRFTLPLLRGLDLDHRSHCIVCGDSVPVAKPDPASLRMAAETLRLAPSKNIFYIGDDERDVQASLAAGMTPVVARYGYLGNEKPVNQWGATLFIDTALALLPLLDRAYLETEIPFLHPS